MEWKNVLVTEEKKNQIKIQETKEQNQILERTFERTLTKQLKLSQSNQKQLEWKNVLVVGDVIFFISSH